MLFFFFKVEIFQVIVDFFFKKPVIVITHASNNAAPFIDVFMRKELNFFP